MERVPPVSFLPLPLHRNAAVALLVAAMVVTGCSDLGDPLRATPAPAGVCELLPASLDLGAVAIGASRDTTFRIANTGTAPLAADIASSCADLVVLAGGGARAIAPGETLAVTVRFSAATSGPAGCSVTTGLACATVDVAANGFTPTTVFFGADIQPILTTNCSIAGCHGGLEPAGAMDLRSGHAYGSTVNVVSAGYAPAVRVVPGQPDQSVLYLKVTGVAAYGDKMPQGGSLTASEQQKIRTWIAEGARNN